MGLSRFEVALTRLHPGSNTYRFMDTPTRFQGILKFCKHIKTDSMAVLCRHCMTMKLFNVPTSRTFWPGRRVRRQNWSDRSSLDEAVKWWEKSPCSHISSLYPPPFFLLTPSFLLVSLFFFYFSPHLLLSPHALLVSSSFPSSFLFVSSLCPPGLIIVSPWSLLDSCLSPPGFLFSVSSWSYIHFLFSAAPSCSILLLVLKEQLRQLQTALLTSILDMEEYKQACSSSSPIDWTDGLLLVHSCPPPVDQHLLRLLGHSAVRTSLWSSSFVYKNI